MAERYLRLYEKVLTPQRPHRATTRDRAGLNRPRGSAVTAFEPVCTSLIYYGLA